MAEAGSCVAAGVRPPRLVEASPGELRYLSPAAFRLWRALVRVRVNELEWFSVDLDTLRRRAKIGSYGSALNALAQLKHAGLVATSRNQRSRWIKDERGRVVSVNAYTTNSYLVAGFCERTRGGFRVKFPARPWTEYVAGCRWNATRASVRVAPWRYEIGRAQWCAEWSKESLVDSRGSSMKTQDLGVEVVGSVLTKESNSATPEASEKALRDSLEHETGADLIEYALQDDLTPDLPGVISLGHNPPLRRDVRVPSRPIDPTPHRESDIQWMSTELVPEQKALFVVNGYRAAVEKVYGVQWWHYWKGEIKRAKHFDKFVKCGEVMAEKSVPAEHWAIWRLTWMKANIKQFSKKPPPIWVVMNAKQVSERAGWFRKEYVLPMPVYEVDWIRREQLARNEEARLFARGHKNPWSCLPAWYGEKRRAEIRDGLLSPFDCYPDRHGSPWPAGPIS